jgi:hypothetical protein
LEIKENTMEKDIALGTAGDLDILFSGGKLTFVVKAATPGAEVSAGMNIVVDGGLLIDKLKAAVEAKFPASAPIDELVFGILKTTLAQM